MDSPIHPARPQENAALAAEVAAVHATSAERSRWLRALVRVGRAILAIEVTKAIAVVILLGTAGVLVSRAREQTLDIEPIAVPEALAKHGYIAETLARRLRESIEGKVQEATFHVFGSEVAIADDALSTIEVPTVGISFANGARLLRQVFGWPQETIAGELTVVGQGEVEPDAATLELRLRHNRAEFFRSDHPFSPAALDNQLAQGAQALLDRLKPSLGALALLETDPRAANARAGDVVKRAERVPHRADQEELARAHVVQGLARQLLNLQDDAATSFRIAGEHAERWGKEGVPEDKQRVQAALAAAALFYGVDAKRKARGDREATSAEHEADGASVRAAHELDPTDLGPIGLLIGIHRDHYRQHGTGLKEARELQDLYWQRANSRLQARPTDVEALANMASHLLAFGHPASALATAERALSVAPRSPNIQHIYLKAVASYEPERFETTFDRLTRRYVPSKPDAPRPIPPALLRLRALHFKELGDLQRERALLEELVAKQGDYDGALLRLATIMRCRLNGSAAALELLRQRQVYKFEHKLDVKAMEAGGELRSAWQQTRCERPSSDLRKTLEYAQRDAEVFGDSEQFRMELVKAWLLDISGGNPRYRPWLPVAEDASLPTEAAEMIDNLQFIQRKDPKHPGLFHWAGSLFAHFHRPAEARRRFQADLLLNPSASASRFRLLELVRAMGPDPEAEPFLTPDSFLTGDTPVQVLFEAARAHSHRDLDASLQLLKRALSYDPEYAEARRLRDRLLLPPEPEP